MCFTSVFLSHQGRLGGGKGSTELLLSLSEDEDFFIF